MKRFLAIVSFLGCWVLPGWGQITPLADQYLVNPFLTNPAVAGTKREAPLSLSVRQQWMGMPSAPSFEAITWHQSLLNKQRRFNPRGFLNRGENAFGKVGVGAGIFNVQYGTIRQIGIHADYAYHVYLDKGRLSFGLAPMYHQFIFDKSGLTPPETDVDDPLLQKEKEVIHFLDVNAGIHYFSDHFYGGASVVQLFNSKVSFGELSYDKPSEEKWDNPWLSGALYGYAGLMFTLGDNIVLEPSGLIKYSFTNQLAFQVQTQVSVFESFQAGVFWRYQEAIGFIAGIRTGQLVFRYQFETPVGTGLSPGMISNQVLVAYLL